ncbi:hypothetical protein [Streptomyces sp. HUAS TT20]|uniref:hypothetical protein n=1 Tax=Streptomyces sp. HUAS TT20 TaxID=3447509 RepID=UPI0021D80992|nr:hypothetical protein [Streptomyces sp. HUAS 15-9]UXY30824.1 hypothetical protein N8I87_32570 [Streptomyces sp. HUAS 15-9]
MNVTFRSALYYAHCVTLGSVFTGITADRLWSTVSGGPWEPLLYGSRSDWIFPVICIAVLTAARMLRRTDPRWKTAVIDSILYLTTFIACIAASAVMRGDAAADAIDGAFFIATLAMFTLQLPAAWALIAWCSGHLETSPAQAERTASVSG